MALPRWLTATVGAGAQTVGRAYDYATPGSGTSTLTNAGRSITDPNVVYTGGIGGLVNGKSDFTPVATGGNNNSANLGLDPSQGVLGASTVAGNSGQYNAGGGSMAYENNLADQLRGIISTYDSLNGGVDTASNDAVNNYNTQYNQQAGDLNNEYASATNQLAGQYGARGLADSSYYGNAQDDAKNTYNTNVQSLVDQRNQNLASIGQQAASAKAGYAASKNQYSDILGNLNNYTQDDLNSLGSSLPGALGSAQQAQAGQGTQAQFLQSIQNLPALQEQGGTQLQAQLQKLSATGAPNYAKQQIAQGLINQAQTNDPNAQTVWGNYFNSLLNGQSQ